MDGELEPALNEVQVEDRVSFSYRDDDRYVNIAGIYGGLHITERGAIHLLVHRRWGDSYYDIRRISGFRRKPARPELIWSLCSVAMP